MRNTIKHNYHTHTTRCRHAYGTEREYIEAAIAMGMKTLGFSDHAPLPKDVDKEMPIRMACSEIADYVAEIRALADEYQNQIQIYVGFEIEYIPEFFEEQMKMIDAVEIDYMILGQHFMTPQIIGTYSGNPTLDVEKLKTYVNSSIEAMKTGRFVYFAHPDLINYQGDQRIFEIECRRLCEAMKKLDIPLEINILGIVEDRHYPNPFFWEIVGRVGNEVILGIDVHQVSHITNVDYLDYVYEELIDKFKLNLIEKLPRLSR